MNHLSARLPIASATFLFSLFITNALTVTKRAPACHEQPTPQATPFVSPTAAPPQSSPTPDKRPRISQQEIVNFPGIGQVRVKADATFGQYVRLIFEDSQSGKRLFQEQFYGEGDCFKPDADDPENAPYARFRVMHIAGLPDPLIVGIAVSHGGNDGDWEAVAVGAVNGKLKDLTPGHLSTTDQGGFFFGDLGAGRGLGEAEWQGIWDLDCDCEAHFGEHQYELKVYKWSEEAKRFEWYQVLRTRGQFYSDKKAVRSLGFNLSDVRRSFPDFKDFFE
jgi:hypothetical protein